MAFGYEGPRLRLVPLDRARHLDNCYRWMNDPETTQNLAAGWRLFTLTDEEQFFDQMMNSSASSKDVVMAIELLDGTHIGMSGIHGIDERLRHGHTGTVIGSVAHRGQGYGTEAGHLRCYAAFCQFGLRMLYSEYYVGNSGSEEMQNALGYQQWGVMPQGNFRNGKWLDVVCTYCTREMWEPNAPDWLKKRLG